MGYREYINRRTHLMSLLERGYPGNASELASLVGISRRTFFDYLLEFKEEGYEVEYNKVEKKFKLINRVQ